MQISDPRNPRRVTADPRNFLPNSAGLSPILRPSRRRRIFILDSSFLSARPGFCGYRRVVPPHSALVILNLELDAQLNKFLPKPRISRVLEVSCLRLPFYARNRPRFRATANLRPQFDPCDSNLPFLRAG
jgi:hypothetical protein